VKLSLKRGQISSIKQGDLFVILSEEQIKNLRNKPKTFLETQIASKIPKKQFEGKSSQKVQITSD